MLPTVNLTGPATVVGCSTGSSTTLDFQASARVGAAGVPWTVSAVSDVAGINCTTVTGTGELLSCAGQLGFELRLGSHCSALCRSGPGCCSRVLCAAALLDPAGLRCTTQSAHAVLYAGRCLTVSFPVCMSAVTACSRCRLSHGPHHMQLRPRHNPACKLHSHGDPPGGRLQLCCNCHRGNHCEHHVLCQRFRICQRLKPRAFIQHCHMLYILGWLSCKQLGMEQQAVRRRWPNRLPYLCGCWPLRGRAAGGNSQHLLFQRRF